ncbi:MAG TPA: hypothetical protein PKE29_07785 [Phycisphaerales bacterium]|nr:hypothetical protein [Phycisphaerales bacterium]
MRIRMVVSVIAALVFFAAFVGRSVTEAIIYAPMIGLAVFAMLSFYRWIANLVTKGPAGLFEPDELTEIEKAKEESARRRALLAQAGVSTWNEYVERVGPTHPSVRAREEN